MSALGTCTAAPGFLVGGQLTKEAEKNRLDFFKLGPLGIMHPWLIDFKTSDILCYEGTAGVALAGLLGTVRAQGRPLTDFVNQKIVVVGAGSAGFGVFNMAAQAVSRMAGAEASPQFFILDKDGLITMERKGADPAAAPFAKAPGEIQGLGLREEANLIEVVGSPLSLLCLELAVSSMSRCLAGCATRFGSSCLWATGPLCCWRKAICVKGLHPSFVYLKVVSPRAIY